MPAVSAMPVRSRLPFDETLNAARSKWLAGKVGALILFDDEAGWIAIAVSDEAKRIFSPDSLSAILRDPRLQSQRKHLSPDKLEAAVALLIQQFTELRVKTNEAARRHTLRVALAASAVAAVVVGAAIYGARKCWSSRASRHRHRSKSLRGHTS